jgi:HlyD family type I secretion membrane fusion protein
MTVAATRPSLRLAAGRMDAFRAWLARGMGRARRTRYADFLPEAQTLAEREPAPMARAVIYAVAGAFAALLLWAGLSEVEQVASAPAVVRPAGKVKTVNHPDGGRVARIHVVEGERVAAGDVLFSLDTGTVREEVAKLANEFAALSAEVARLTAEAAEDGGALRFDAALAASRPDLVANERSLFESRRATLASRRAAADQLIEQRSREGAALAARRTQLDGSLVILAEQEAAISQLAGKGYFPKLRHLSVKRQISELEGQIAETAHSARAAAAALAEARDRRRSVDAEWRSAVLDRLGAARREAAQAKGRLAQEQGRLDGRTVVAPVAGRVQNLAVAAAGQSVSANETLLHIVPDGERLVVEARVANEDIGYIRAGQRATVKVRTFDFIRYGTLDGVVDEVAADAVEDQRTGAMAFPVTIRTERDWLEEGGRRHPIAAGMQVEVDLHIGERSLLSYLTDRMSRTAETAFRER